jgi:alpha-D-ribose 1-methylphosphonate 5-triphosphate diphosphatase
MRTVCGAPNVVRGGSHTGNVSAAELISLGLCDGLSSDYLPFAMLGAVGILVRDQVCSIVDAVKLITSGPADTVGLHDRGRLVVGARGDITLCHLDGANPRVIGSFRTGQGASRGLALQDA